MFFIVSFTNKPLNYSVRSTSFVLPHFREKLQILSFPLITHTTCVFQNCSFAASLDKITLSESSNDTIGSNTEVKGYFD